MRISPLTKILLGVLALSVLFSIGLCWYYLSITREMRTLRNQANQINYNSARMNALANDTLEYSKTHPAIDPLLEAVGLKGKTAPTAANKPATK